MALYHTPSSPGEGRTTAPHLCDQMPVRVIGARPLWTCAKLSQTPCLTGRSRNGILALVHAQSLRLRNNESPQARIIITVEKWVTSGEERVRQTTQRAAQMVPLGRPGQLREVGLLALYLASAASNYMTGQTIFLDGGMSL
jgi:hypothetical protein